MNKIELRKKLTELNVDFTDKDSKDALEKKLQQAQLPTLADPSLPYVLFDAEDDAQVLQELQGAVLATFMYAFPMDGKEVVGLSKAGVEQACRESANKKGETYRVIGMPDVKEDADYITITVQAGRYKIILDKQGNFKGEVLLDTTYGSKRQSKKMRRRDGTNVPDNFAYEKALSKAIRNAKMALLPYKYIVEMLKAYRRTEKTGQSNVKVIQANKKIEDAQLKYIHAQAGELKIDHAKLTALCKEKYGYASLNDLEMSQVNEFISYVKSKVPKVPEMPMELIGLFNAKGVLKAKREAIWAREIAKGSADQAIVNIKTMLESEVI